MPLWCPWDYFGHLWDPLGNLEELLRQPYRPGRVRSKVSADLLDPENVSGQFLNTNICQKTLHKGPNRTTTPTSPPTSLKEDEESETIF